MPSNHLFLCHPLCLLPSIFPSIRVFSNESPLRIRWPKYWRFSFSISLSSDYLGLISFRIDWFDLLVVQGTLNSLLQHHSLKASIFQCSAFFMVQLSHSYIMWAKWLTSVTRKGIIRAVTQHWPWMPSARSGYLGPPGQLLGVPEVPKEFKSSWDHPQSGPSPCHILSKDRSAHPQSEPSSALFLSVYSAPTLVQPHHIPPGS